MGCPIPRNGCMQSRTATKRTAQACMSSISKRWDNFRGFSCGIAHGFHHLCLEIMVLTMSLRVQQMARIYMLQIGFLFRTQLVEKSAVGPWRRFKLAWAFHFRYLV